MANESVNSGELDSERASMYARNDYENQKIGQARKAAADPRTADSKFVRDALSEIEKTGRVSDETAYGVMTVLDRAERQSAIDNGVQRRLNESGLDEETGNAVKRAINGTATVNDQLVIQGSEEAQNIISESQDMNQRWVRQMRNDMRNVGREKTTTSKSEPVSLIDGTRGRITGITEENGSTKLTFETADGQRVVNDYDVNLNGGIKALVTGAEKIGGKAANAIYNSYLSGQDVGQYLSAAEYVSSMARSTQNAEKTLQYVLNSDMAAALEPAQVKAIFESASGDEVRRVVKAAKGNGVVTYKGQALTNNNFNALTKGLKADEKRAVRIGMGISKLTGLEVHFFESKADQNGNYIGKNGEYINGRIEIDINALRNNVSDARTGMMVMTMSHELTHYLMDASPAEYSELKAYVMDSLISGDKSLDSLINDKILRTSDRNFTYDKALDEVVADACEMMFTNSNAFTQLAENHTGLAKSMLEWLGNFTKRLRKLASKLSANDEAAKYFMEHADLCEKLQEKWDSAMLNAIAAGKADPFEVDYSVQNSMRNMENDDGNPLFSMRTMKQDYDGYKADCQELVDRGIMKASELKNLFKAIDYVISEIDKASPENKKLLDTQITTDLESRKFKPYKDNSDPHYKQALDFSTLCRKRLVQMAIIDRLQECLKRNLSAQDQIIINKRLRQLQEDGLQIEIACDLCYVEAARYKTPEWVNRFLDNGKRLCAIISHRRIRNSSETERLKSRRKWGISARKRTVKGSYQARSRLRHRQKNAALTESRRLRNSIREP